MRTKNTFYFLSLSLVFVLSGCVVRTYPLTRDRVDQDLTGNRGYIQGKAPAEDMTERKTTRTTRVLEIELHSPLKFEKMKQNKAVVVEKEEERSTEGNRGYITQSAAPEINEPVNTEKYTVEKGDTLQKISQKFYGTTKRWHKIFEANKEKLKAPNKVYPGQVLEIPVEGLKDTKTNLK